MATQTRRRKPKTAEIWEPASVVARPTPIEGAIAAAQLVVVAFVLGSCLVFGLAYVGLFLDDNAYHLPSAVRIAQHWNPYFVGDSPVDAHWFPAGAEALVAVFVALAGSLSLSNLSGALCAGALVVLMYRFAGLWGADRLGRLATVACTSTIPLLIGQSLAFYVDVHFALLLCLAVYWQTVAVRNHTARSAYYGLAMALLLPSIKYSGLLTGLVLVPASGFCLWQATAPRRPDVKSALAVLAAAGFSGGWYVRNWLVRGNPVYPFAVPAWIRPLLTFGGAPYEFDPEHHIISPRTAWPHPYVPGAWLRHDYTPHMTDDAFGASVVIAGGCAVLALALARHLTAAERRAWWFVLGICVLLITASPYGLEVPRYMLAVAVLLSLGPAVLTVIARRMGANRAAVGVSAAILAFSGVYAVQNLLTPEPVASNVCVAASCLFPYQPCGSSEPYAARGHLRIGYTSGFGNLIAALYDPGLTNTLVPLHYKNYAYNYGREMASPEEFIRYVNSLRLDYIHVFDARYPGVDLLRQHFRDKIMPPEMR